MKTATVRELRNHYSAVLKWIEAGEEVAISKRGVVIARLVPEKRRTAGRVDWTKSAAFRRDRSGERILSVEESAALLDNKGNW
ncbi:MAG: type II toxin-antitoxin system Phd/YefM family antitoxin [Verrucomicrobia bacterium]|nr:type II toxin-antitoxin system Phd/YefM family antitoxin [Verrucomicrobiota bacterium]